MKVKQVRATHTVAVSITYAFILFYLICFILYHLRPDLAFIDMDRPIAIFAEFKYVIPIFLLSIFSSLYLGRGSAIDDIEQINYNYSVAIDAKIEKLIVFINLAKVLTKNDTDELIADFIKKLDKERNE